MAEFSGSHVKIDVVHMETSWIDGLVGHDAELHAGLVPP